MLNPEQNIKSFNEEEVINFEPKEHAYTHVVSGKTLTGATTFIKKYIKQFDIETVALNCEKNWFIDANYIKKSWQMNGNIASMFGSSLHAALEFEDLYRKHRKKNGDRCFQIKHPMIRKVVDDFFSYAKGLGLKGKPYPEVLISDVENGICALADRLIVTSEERKECILCDYKINYDYNVLGKEEFINLPAEINLPTNKLSKLALQLRFQEQILEKSGWNVIDKIAFVYELDWKHYKVPDLKGFNILTGKMEL
jgi:hypothetical protein